MLLVCFFIIFTTDLKTFGWVVIPLSLSKGPTKLSLIKTFESLFKILFKFIILSNERDIFSSNSGCK